MKRIATALIAVGLILSGCSTDVNDALVDGAKKASESKPWFDRVENWNDATFGDIDVKTDFLDTDIEAYLPAFEICEAFVKQYAPDADTKPNLKIYGIQRDTRTNVDGSKETSERDVIIAQAQNTTKYQCKVSPPYDLEDQARSLGLETP